ncbi:hypothetical protein [Arachidicoccus soli]|uniref:Uncharacterized protein n=1 Tax=Arachidicoccus soli TaxID=2341117 RepID=A0A386HNM9_9BACT|nr:hypothetical protein [Arachidicoccus soli]AYD47363.1 hypothetical protein D6B99_06905 [Arachidicoccus soli]
MSVTLLKYLVISRFDKITVKETTVKKIAQDARLAKSWIFVGTQWYTPGELESNLRFFMKYSFEEFRIKDPRLVIPKGRARIWEIQKLQLEFEKKVNDFYAGRLK